MSNKELIEQILRKNGVTQGYPLSQTIVSSGEFIGLGKDCLDKFGQVYVTKHQSKIYDRTKPYSYFGYTLGPTQTRLWVDDPREEGDKHPDVGRNTGIFVAEVRGDLRCIDAIADSYKGGTAIQQQDALYSCIRIETLYHLKQRK